MTKVPHDINNPEALLHLEFKSALRQFSAFLRDPEKIAQYHRQLNHIIAGQKQVFDLYRVNATKTAAFKNMMLFPSFETRDPALVENAACRPFKIGTKSEQGAMIAFGQRHFEQNESAARKKVILHELMHAYHLGEKNKMPEIVTMRSEQLHVEEFSCDAAADIIQPWPRFSDMRAGWLEQDQQKQQQEQQALLEKFKQTAYFQNLPDAAEAEETAMELIQKCDIKQTGDSPSVTHPAENAMIAMSKDLCDQLAAGRYDAYLENLYDGFVPGYADPVTKHSTSTFLPHP